MRTLPSGMQAHLDAGATTLCYCWKVTRVGASPLGFTDHDRPLTFDGVTYEAASGFEATAIEQALGLAVPNQDIAGALSSAAITENDLAGGRYDGASVEIWRVNWADVSQRLMIAKGEIGEVRRDALSFTAELRGLAHRLDAPQGRNYQFACDADLGDARCKVNLTSGTVRGTGAVTAAPNRRQFTASGLTSFADGWFAGGRLAWTSGANTGLSQTVKAHAAGALDLWEAMPFAVAIGDAFAVTAGCDKRFDTCKTKFANALNFRGNPLMPGNDWVVAAPRDGENNDGGKLTS
jgi:uncharacterized phage protein (TIGR02218 family)